jgi:hypothetical protein
MTNKKTPTVAVALSLPADVAHLVKADTSCKFRPSSGGLATELLSKLDEAELASCRPTLKAITVQLSPETYATLNELGSKHHLRNSDILTYLFEKHYGV